MFFIYGNKYKKSLCSPKFTYKLYLNRFHKHYPDYETMNASQSNGYLTRAYAHIFADNENIIREDVFITNSLELVYNAVYTYIQAIKMAIENTPKYIIMEKNNRNNKFLQIINCIL